MYNNKDTVANKDETTGNTIESQGRKAYHKPTGLVWAHTDQQARDLEEIQ